ncbi:hypothetical protein N657DRAFT_694624 [Parathielavia appendiculata]|uniref:Uncharacterized protein n=1 Tax=Parathielavia appendiculata TaxID=2587402 RepID=A0AAN6YXT5_9PEZI|nr:hypothetical protein N657DRAFT_694624 [Parathielavia appendiculata]
MVQHTALSAIIYAGLVSAGANPQDAVDKLAESSLPKLEEWLIKNPQPGYACKTAAKRKEWSDLSLAERKQYTDAILCLQSKPALTSR